MLTMYTSSFLKKVEANLLNANELLKDDDTFEAVVDDIFFFVMVIKSYVGLLIGYSNVIVSMYGFTQVTYLVI